MERLKLKHEASLKALKILERKLAEIEKIKLIEPIEGISKEQILESLRDSVIQSFEYSIDTLWKYLKEYILKKKGVKQAHPKPVFRECLKAGLITPEETELTIKMVDDRNITSHAYNEKIAISVFENIPKYIPTMKKLLSNANF